MYFTLSHIIILYSALSYIIILYSTSFSFIYPLFIMAKDLFAIFTLFSSDNVVIPAENVTKALMCAGCMLKGDEELDTESPTFSEFKKLVATYTSTPVTRDIVENAFRVYDPEETGYIRAADLQAIMNANNGDSEASASQRDFTDFTNFGTPDDRGMICYNLLIDAFFDQ